MMKTAIFPIKSARATAREGCPESVSSSVQLRPWDIKHIMREQRVFVYLPLTSSHTRT